MPRIITMLVGGLCCLSLLAGCGGEGSARAATMAPSEIAARPGTAVATSIAWAGGTAAETALAYIRAWEAQDAAAPEGLLTPGARSAWAMGGGMGKWLADQRGGKDAPLAGQGRLLAVAASGGSATADVAVVYPCADCQGDRLPDWPPVGSVALSARLTMEQGTDGLWLVSYLDGSDYLRRQAAPTRTVRVAATNTAYAASMEATRTARGAQINKTATARTAGAIATQTAGQAILNATATALWAQWFPQPTTTPQPANTRKRGAPCTASDY